MFDGTQVRPEPVRVTVTNGLITEVIADEGALPAATPELAVLDAPQATLLPGLIDAHTHLFGTPACTPGKGAGLEQVTRNLHSLVAAGITTVADLAGPPAAAVALRNWVGVGRHRGPRVLVAGAMLTTPQGYMTDLHEGELVKIGMARPLASPEEAREVVREMREADVDLIKVGLQASNYNDTPLALMSKETLCAAVEEAHRQELRLVVHATEESTTASAIACGADALVHGGLEPLSDSTLASLGERKTPVAPTWLVFRAPWWGPEHPELLEDPEAQRNLTEEVREDLAAYRAAYDAGGEHLPPFMLPGIARARAKAVVPHQVANMHGYREAGVPIAFGSDAPICFNLAGRPALELSAWVREAGLTPVEALRAATVGSATLLNLHDALGRVQVGYRADLLLVEGEPDRSLEDLRAVKAVLIDGVPQRLEPAGLGERVSLGLSLVWSWIAH